MNYLNLCRVTLTCVKCDASRIRKRKEYEDALRRQRHNLGIWIRYAQWEAAQKEFRR